MPLPLANNDVATGLDDNGLPLRRIIIDGSDPSNNDNSPASFDQRFISPTQPNDATAIQEYLAAKHYFGDSQRKVLPLDYVKSLPDVGEPLIGSGPKTSGTKIGNKLVGTGGEERYITWPEKVIHDALSAPSGAMANNPYPEGSEEYSAFENYRNQGMVPAALNMSALAGTGGLAGAGEDAGAATLGAGPFLRPALKYQGKIYKAPVGGQHMDAIPANLQAEFTRQAMNGEDISNFNFGFMNHKGHFLNREDALKYAIDEGLLSPHDAKFGALTSTMGFNTPEITPSNLNKVLSSNVKDYRAAIKSGDNYYSGQEDKNLTHPIIYGEMMRNLGGKPEKIDGFIDNNNNFLTRDEFNKKFGINESTELRPKLTSTLMADSSKPGTAIDAMSKQPFYSTLEKNVNDIGQSKMTGDQWLGTLSNKSGVKPEEMQYTGLQDFLASKGKATVTKAEVQQHLNNNKVELVEVDKQAPNLDKSSPYYNKEVDRVLNNDVARGTFDDMHLSLSNDAKAHRTLMDKHPELKSDDDWASTVLNSVVKGGGNTKYGSYQLPGGQNYREHLLTLPSTKNTLTEFKVIRPDGHVDSTYANAEGAANRAQSIGGQVQQGKTQTLDGGYKTHHWDELNVLAHMRTNERDVGSVPSLHIEEIQSDWHQQGRDKGYASPENKARYDKLIEDKHSAATKVNQLESQFKAELAKTEGFDSLTNAQKTNKFNELKNSSKEYQDAYNAYKGFDDEIAKGNPHLGVPDAPFKKSWPELAMKRAIRTAVEDGKSRVSWTPGEAQAARYDLSKQLDRVLYNPKTQRIEAFDKMNRLAFEKTAKPEELSDIIGKEAADKLISSPLVDNGGGVKQHRLENADLKVGGEGMKGFYDQMLPKMVEKLGKKYGVKVKQERINKPEFAVSPEKLEDGRMVYDVHINGKLYSSFHTKEEAEAVASKAEKEKKGTPVHYFDIPEKMKQDILTKGFPLFSNPLPIPNQRND